MHYCFRDLKCTNVQNLKNMHFSVLYFYLFKCIRSHVLWLWLLCMFLVLDLLTD